MSPGTPPADPGVDGVEHVVHVKGDSMEPALSDGDVVRIRAGVPIVVGDIVVARHPFKRDVLVVKRVAAIDGDRYDLRGDAPGSSTDSRTLGWFQRSRILGRVVTVNGSAERYEP